MKKIVKEHYQDILADLKPLMEKWGEDGLVGTLWTYRRNKGRVKDLEKKKIEIEQELKQAKIYENLPS